MIRRFATALLLALPLPVMAQVQLETAGDFQSGFQNRGLTLTNRPVIQPALTLAAESGAGTLALTAWSNYELAAYDAADELSALDGRGGFTELDLVLEASRTFGRLGVTAGGIHYLYAEDAAGEAEPATTEVLLAVAWEAALSPSIALYQDVGTVRGLYAEAALDWTVPRARELALRAALGWSRGLADLEDEAAYYDRDGFTHAELIATLPLPLGPVQVEPTLRGVLGFDPATRVTAPDRDRRFKVFAGFRLSWSGPSAGAGGE